MTVEGAVANLTHDLIHYSYTDLSDVLSKLERYSTASAKEMIHRQKKPSSLFSAALHGVWAFFRTFILRAGFLDGSAGLMLAVYNAEYTYYKYLKHREMAHNKQMTSIS